MSLFLLAALKHTDLDWLKICLLVKTTQKSSMILKMKRTPWYVLISQQMMGKFH